MTKADALEADGHWESAAAEIEAGNCDESDKLLRGSDWRKGLEAYRERVSAKVRHQ